MAMVALGFGAVALVCWCLSIQVNDKKGILRLQSVANALYAVQYGLLGVYSAMSMNMVSVVRSIVFYKFEDEKKAMPKWVLAIFFVILLALGGITYDGLFNTIPVIITMLYAYSMWQKNLLVVRCIYIGVAIVWLYYNFTVGAYASFVGNVVEIVSGVSAIIRHNNMNKKTD